MENKAGISEQLELFVNGVKMGPEPKPKQEVPVQGITLVKGNDDAYYDHYEWEGMTPASITHAQILLHWALHIPTLSVKEILEKLKTDCERALAEIEEGGSSAKESLVHALTLCMGDYTVLSALLLQLYPSKIFDDCMFKMLSGRDNILI